VDGKVEGIAGHAAAWRCSTTGAERTVVARSGRIIEYFMVVGRWQLSHC
jgi:hypothetical protein